MPKRRRSTVQYLLRLYPGQDDDLIAWLERFDDRPYGVKTQEVKDALRRGIGGEAASPSTSASVDMAEVRRVVEAAVTQALTRFGVHGGGGVATLEQDDETETLLDDLGAALVVE